jgi:HD-GYP domain-containing protein (c-di-GMP phosphodiesterase class II)
MSYLPVRISTLKNDVVLGFDLYLQLPHKTIKYVLAEDSVEESKLKSLKERKIRKMFILDQDEKKYQDFMDRCLSEAMSDDSLGLEQKSQLVVDASENNAEKIMADPHSQKSYHTAQDTTKKLIEVLASNDELLKGIFDRVIDNENADDASKMHKHSVNTASLCISFAEYLKLDKDTINALGVAGLFHDIAYGQMNSKAQELFFKPLANMTADELTLYKTHPKVAAEILQDKDFASPKVIELILAHEERQGGNGFPNKLAKLSLAQEVLCLSAYYDQRLTCFGENRSDVLKDLAISQLGNFELTTINKFKEFLNKAGLK